MNANGNLSNLVYPGNRTVTYLYDSLNRLTNVTDWATRTTTFTYDLANRVTNITRPNNTVRTINYDTAGETTNIIERTTTGFPIAFFTLGWTNSGRVAWEFAGPLPHQYTPPYRSMAYNDDNQITTLNNTNTLAYDLDGNMTTGPLTNNALTTYTYDARNRLLAVGNLQYGYDPAGNRASITNGTNVVRFVVNPNAALPQVLMRITGGTTNYYIYGLGLLYEITETATSTNTLTYHYDYRGSTVALTDGNGMPTDRIEYSAYGMTSYRAGTNDTPFLYNGRYGVMTDPNGLLYMRARYYNPYICRFINPDPSGFAGGLNFYCYADGNPISLIDPFGLLSWQDAGDYFQGVGQVFAGYGQAIGDTATGIYNVAVHPINTGVGLVNVATHPVQAYNAISQSAVNTWNSGLQGQGRIVGNALIAAATIGSGQAIASARVAQIAEPDELAQGLSKAQILSQWETGSAALNNADFEALGGLGTSPLFKAPYIADWADTAGNALTTTWYQSIGKSAQLFFQGSGLTPQAYLRMGYGLPAAGLAGNISGLSSTGK